MNLYTPPFIDKKETGIPTHTKELEDFGKSERRNAYKLPCQGTGSVY
jgi:hypothetical protein